jgi:endonuclease/exonuclease/phosphatase family metal-dependent hydrolase
MKLDADIIFLQEYSPLFEAYISKKADYLFVTDKSKDTIIVVKKSSFHVFEEPSQVLTQAEISSLNWAEKTSILIADKIILLSAHLSSNKEKNPAQIASLKEGLISLAKNHPNYRIILGGDLNSFLQPEPVF